MYVYIYTYIYIYIYITIYIYIYIAFIRWSDALPVSDRVRDFSKAPDVPLS